LQSIDIPHLAHRTALISGHGTESWNLLPSPLQSAIPALESEMLLIIAAIVWFLVMFTISRRMDKKKKRHSEAISFLVFVAGLLVILSLLH